VRDVGKVYRQYGSEWNRLAGWFGISIPPRSENWVVRHVSFDIAPGEAVGVIGQNGAGKSTLLKLITGTVRPSEGNCGSVGRVSAILELGLGFNPELTGRENVVHVGGLMGYSSDRVHSALHGIEEFAEIGPYFNQPVRMYSSGMQMRVAFAVATAFPSEVLIIDEAMSVGDAYFQHKSFDRIRRMRDDGTSLLFVSHDREAVQSFCDRALLMDGGRLIKDGAPTEVVDLYNGLIAAKESGTVQQVVTADGKIQTESGSGEAVVATIGLFDQQGKRVDQVSVGDEVEIRVDVNINAYVPRLVFGYMIRDRLGQVMYGTNTHHTQQQLTDLHAGQRVMLQLMFPVHIGPGTYSVSTALVSTDTHLVNNYQWKDLALVFTVLNTRQVQFGGSCWMQPRILIERAS